MRYLRCHHGIFFSFLAFLHFGLLALFFFGILEFWLFGIFGIFASLDSKVSMMEEQSLQEIFSYICEMNDLPFNYGKKNNCELGCSYEMNNEHLLNLPYLNQGNMKMEYN